jgi:intein/homing endonuclease
MAWEKGHQILHKKFDKINEEILNTKGFLEEEKAKVLLYKFLKENPSFTSELISGVSLFPFQHMAIKAMMETDYFLGIWCLSEDEYVLTENGFKKIKDIQVGEMVRSREQLNLVTDKRINPLEDGLEITLKSGDSFKAKIGHKTLIFRDFQFQFEEIQNIKEGDVVPVKLGTDVWGNQDIFKDFNFKNKQHLFYWLGYVLGDGYINQDGVHYCSENYEIQEAILKFTQANDFKMYARQRSANLNFYEYSVFNRELVKALESIGWDKSLKSKDKLICDQILAAEKGNLCALIGGLFDADGYASFQPNNSKVGLKNTSLQLLRQVKMLLNNLGVESNLRLSGQNNDVPYYDLVLTNDASSLKKFQEEIDFIVSHKKSNLQKIIDRSSSRNYQNKLIPRFGQLLKKEGSREKLCGKKGQWGIDFSQNELDNLQDLSEDTKYIIDSIKEERVAFSVVKTIAPCQVRSVDITVENEECYIGNGIVHHNSRGLSKSFTTGIFAAMDAILNQGVYIGIISKSFRQSRMIFNKIEEIAKSPKAAFLSQCITRVSKSNDQWVMEIGRSKIIALPLGDGEKLRGFRFQRMIIDELLLMPEKIINEVILPFLAVVENPTERQKIYDLETKMIAAGKMKEEDRHKWPHNKIIGLSSASYKFEYLYKLYQQYENLILNPSKQDNAHRVIMHLSYDCAPKQLYDQNLLDQSKATMSEAQFEREFGSVFTDDSSGYFKVSKMAACTIPDGEGQSVEVIGDKNAEYILSFDPSWSESEGSDDFAMHVIKLNADKRSGTIVHSYALAGANLKKHIVYFHYLYTHFNITMIVGDYNGGVQFINSCNESEIFKKAGIQIQCIDVDFDDPQNYAVDLRIARNQYNVESKKICILRKPSSQWIRSANEMLQAAFDHKKIWFAGAALDDDYSRQKAAVIPIDELSFSRYNDDVDSYAKQIDLIEHLKATVDTTKVQCALIQVSTTTNGSQSFDLPHNLKKQRNADKARKDSYSALVLGNWMMNIYFDMMATPTENVQATFVPMFVD